MLGEPAAPLVAVVDDDESVRSALTAALQSAGFAAFAFASAESFLDFDRLGGVGCLITDLKMPGMSGLELQAELQRDNDHIAIIFMTARGGPGDRMRALAAGAVAFLDKPFDDELLLRTVRAIIER